MTVVKGTQMILFQLGDAFDGTGKCQLRLVIASNWTAVGTARTWGNEHVPSQGGWEDEFPFPYLRCSRVVETSCQNPHNYPFSHGSVESCPKFNVKGCQRKLILEIHLFSTKPWLWEEEQIPSGHILQSAKLHFFTNLDFLEIRGPISLRIFFRNTPRKFNSLPLKNYHLSQKGKTCLPTIIFQRRDVKLRGCIIFTLQICVFGKKARRNFFMITTTPGRKLYLWSSYGP